MKRFVLVGICLVLLAGAFSAPVQAQENRFEFNLGANFPLVSRTFDADQTLGYFVRFGYRVNESMTLGVVYDSRSTLDDLGSGYDVGIDLYGVSGVWVLSGDPGFQLLAIASVGIGEFSWENPGEPVSGFRDTVDIDFWYEFGGGAQFTFRERFTARVTATFRGMHPKNQALILHKSRTEIVPAVSLGFQF